MLKIVYRLIAIELLHHSTERIWIRILLCVFDGFESYRIQFYKSKSDHGSELDLFSSNFKNFVMQFT